MLSCLAVSVLHGLFKADFVEKKLILVTRKVIDLTILLAMNISQYAKGRVDLLDDEANKE